MGAHPKLNINRKLQAAVPDPQPILRQDANKTGSRARQHDAHQAWIQNLDEFIKSRKSTPTIYVWRQTKAIVDGIQTYKICRKHGVRLQVEYLDFDNVQDAMLWRFRANVSTRRHLPPFIRARQVYIQFRDNLLEELKAKAKANRKGRGKKVPPEQKINITRMMARAASVPESDMNYSKNIIEYIKRPRNEWALPAYEIDRKIRLLENGVESPKKVYHDIKAADKRNVRRHKTKRARQELAVTSTLPIEYLPGKCNYVIHGDVIEKLKEFPDSSIDRFAFSPPYYEAHIDYGEEFTFSENWSAYRTFTRQYLTEMWRILADNGCIAVNVDNTRSQKTGTIYYHTELVRGILTQLGLKDRHSRLIDGGEYIWLKNVAIGRRDPMGSEANPRARRNHEYVLFFYKQKTGQKREVMSTMTKKEFALFSLSSWEPTARDEMTDLDRNLWGSAWKISSRRDPDHPAIFPPELARRMIVYGGSTDDIICDPFAGSGTSLEVAARNGRRYIGVEQNSRWAEKAAEAGKRGERAFRNLEREAANKISKRLKKIA